MTELTEAIERVSGYLNAREDGNTGIMATMWIGGRQLHLKAEDLRALIEAASQAEALGRLVAQVLAVYEDWVNGRPPSVVAETWLAEARATLPAPTLPGEPT